MARPLGMLLGMAAVVLLALALIAAFATVIRAIGGSAPSTGGNLGAGALIVALLGAPFLIWGTLIKHRTLSAQMDGQITDRIAKAVEQLGAEKTVKQPDENGAVAERTRPNIEVRIGAILSLERIAQDSTSHDHGRDHVRVMEILCAYLRENAPASGAEERNPKKHPTIEEWVQSLKPLREDVALALKVIGRRNADQRLVEAAWPDPPSSTTFWVFDTQSFAQADSPNEKAMTQADLSDFWLRLGNWKESVSAYHGYRLDLRATNLQRSDLFEAILGGALLDNARLEGANLGQARLDGASLNEAKLDGANATCASLVAADLRGAGLAAAQLVIAQMAGAILCDARLQGAHLTFARLTGADLSRAQVDGSTILFEADFSKSASKDIDFSSNDMLAYQLTSMFGDASVILAPGIPRPARWPTWKLPEYGRSGFLTEWSKWQADPTTYTPPPPPRL
ncbi:MAG: pentapeptide repeat-containing protein [Pseudorhodobacter sp.]|nr:pentapeptide repeat-containing protein [Pseudorhodobacter sp.]